MKHRGRQRTKPRTRRGRDLVAELDRRGLTLHQAAAKAGISFTTLYRLIHDDPGRQSVSTVEAACERLGLPLALVAPRLQQLAAAPEANALPLPA